MQKEFVHAANTNMLVKQMYDYDHISDLNSLANAIALEFKQYS